MSKKDDIIKNNYGWYAVDDCEDSMGEYTETWIGRLGDDGGYEYIEGKSWSHPKGFFEEHAREATPEEIQHALTLEVKREYEVPCTVQFIDGATKHLNGHVVWYDPETDALYASENEDILYHRGTWAEKLEIDDTQTLEEFINEHLEDVYAHQDIRRVFEKGVKLGIEWERSKK